jgi:mannose-6-phosphate isomerase-like protein (cupin superfamily)
MLRSLNRDREVEMAEMGTVSKEASDLSIGDLTALTDGYDAPSCVVLGPASSIGFHPQGFSLWQMSGILEPGTELEWGIEHGDEALYIRAGELEIADNRVREGGVLIVESGVAALVRAVVQTSVLHQGPTDPEAPVNGLIGPPAAADRGVHVLGPTDAQRVHTPSGHNDFFADSTCPTCRISCFIPSIFTDGRESQPFIAPSHSHSEDEIIHILDGEMRMGRHRLTPGMSVAIPGGRRYGFRLPKGCRFLNYRRDLATVTFAPGSPPMLETIEILSAWTGDNGAV